MRLVSIDTYPEFAECLRALVVRLKTNVKPQKRHHGHDDENDGDDGKDRRARLILRVGLALVVHEYLLHDGEDRDDERTQVDEHGLDSIPAVAALSMDSPLRRAVHAICLDEEILFLLLVWTYNVDHEMVEAGDYVDFVEFWDGFEIVAESIDDNGCPGKDGEHDG